MHVAPTNEPKGLATAPRWAIAPRGMLGQLPAMAMRPFLRGCAVAPMVEACCGTHGGGALWRPWGNKASMSAAVCMVVAAMAAWKGGVLCTRAVVAVPMASVPVLWRP